MRRFFAAWGFLTVIPCPFAHPDAPTLGKSVPFFPVMGLLIGAMGYAAAWVLFVKLALPITIGAMVLTLLLGAISGGLHLDGLADTADGFLSSRPRERILDIMRDSRIGTMGVLGLLAVLSLKAGAFSELPPSGVCVAAMLAPLAGRVALVLNMTILPYARPEGLAAVFYTQRRGWHAIWAILVLAGGGWLLAREAGLILAGMTVVVTGVWALLTFRKIGGATGDTLGAGCELVECAVPLAMLALLP